MTFKPRPLATILRGRLIWKKGMEWNQGKIFEGLGMKLDSFSNVFGREEECNQILILIFGCEL